jgi:hypothetical protein
MKPLTHGRLTWMTVLLAFLLPAAIEASEPERGAESADTNETNASTYVDTVHDYLSDELVHWSSVLDESLVGVIGDANRTRESRMAALEKQRQASDRFFQTGKYLDETTHTYARLRFDLWARQREANEANVNVRLHLPLARTRHRLRIFVNDLTEDNVKDLIQANDQPENPKVGVNYFAPEAFGIVSKYSLGFSGIYPYVRARYSTLVKKGDWIIEPVQIFEYSTRDDFAESTDFYFDTEPREGELMRFQLNRGTRSHEPGMYYGFGFSYSWIFSPHTGLRFIQSFAGDTEYVYTPEGGDEQVSYSGIYNIHTALEYRRNIWRKWLFVQVMPAVDFSRQYDYKSDFSIRFYFDMLFGNY